MATERKIRYYRNEARIFYTVWLIELLPAQRETGWLTAALFGLVVTWDLIRRWRLGPRESLNLEEHTALTEEFAKSPRLLKALKGGRVLKLAGNFSVGASVVDLLKVKIALTQGLIISLRKQNKTARFVLCHELAHVLILDRIALFVALMMLFLTATSSAVLFFFFIMGDSFRDLLIIFWLLSLIDCAACLYFLHHREFVADEIARDLMGPETDAAALLKYNAKPAWSLFHPNLQARRQNLSGQLSLLRTYWLHAFYFFRILTILLVMWLAPSEFETEEQSLYAIVVTVCAVGIFWNLSKAWKTN